jgi:hypothetical protein
MNRTAKEILDALDDGKGISDKELLYLGALYQLIDTSTRKLPGFELASFKAAMELYSLESIFSARQREKSNFESLYKIDAIKVIKEYEKDI